MTWNRSRKRDRWGQHRQTARPEGEWMRQHVPDLRIVSEEAWQAAQSRLRAIRTHLMTVSGGRVGVRSRDTESRHLLSGFARCALCGASFYPMSRSHGSQRAFFYGCSATHKRGHTVCGNNLVMRVEGIDDAVLGALAGDVLRPAVVMAVIDGVVQELAPEVRAGANARARLELDTLDREIGRLTEAIAGGGPMESLLAALKGRQARRDDLADEMAARDAINVRTFERRAIERAVRDHVERWRALLTTHVEDGRRLLREVLAGPIRFTPERRAYAFEGQVSIGQLLSGMAGVAPLMASLTGFEPVWTRENQGEIEAA